MNKTKPVTIDLPKPLVKALRSYGFSPREALEQFLVSKVSPDAITKKVESDSKYELSARAAANLLGVSTPTMIRYAKNKPDQFPHISIKMGTRTMFRFSSDDVEKYITDNLMK